MSVRLIDLDTVTADEMVEINSYTYAKHSGQAGTVHLDVVDASGAGACCATLTPAQARSLASQLEQCARAADAEAEHNSGAGAYQAHGLQFPAIDVALAGRAESAAQLY